MMVVRSCLVTRDPGWERSCGHREINDSEHDKDDAQDDCGRDQYRVPCVHEASSLKWSACMPADLRPWERTEMAALLSRRAANVNGRYASSRRGVRIDSGAFPHVWKTVRRDALR